MKEKIKKEENVYLMLFGELLKISATTFGGGFVIVPLLKSKFVDEKQLIDEEEMLDLMAIAESTPGPIAVNGSVLTGYKIAGVKGALTALLATVIPPLAIISLISLIYEAVRDNHVIRLIMRGMLCGVTAVVADVVISMIKNHVKGVVSYIILLAAFASACIFNVNILLIIGVSAAAGLMCMLIRRLKKHDIS